MTDSSTSIATLVKLTNGSLDSTHSHDPPQTTCPLETPDRSELQDSLHTIRLSAEMSKLWLRYKRDMNFVLDEEFLTFLFHCAMQSLSREFSDTIVKPNSTLTPKSARSLPHQPSHTTLPPQHSQRPIQTPDSSSSIETIHTVDAIDHVTAKYDETSNNPLTEQYRVCTGVTSTPQLHSMPSFNQNQTSPSQSQNRPSPALCLSQKHTFTNLNQNDNSPRLNQSQTFLSVNQTPHITNQTPPTINQTSLSPNTASATLCRTQTSPGFECVSCKKIFGSKSYLARHVKRGCDEVNPSWLSRCQYCSATYRSMTRLRTHVKQKHRDVRYSCDQCDKQFKNAEYIQQHVRVAHNHIKDHKCRECGKDFTQRGTLLSHVRTVHQKQRNFSCRLCDRSFGCKSHLTRHIGKIHVDSMGNECEICGKIFDKSSDLLSHTKLLHYETEYICNVCSKAFKLKHTLAKHILKIHPDKKDVG